MGHKVHPIGFRLGFIKDWQSKWYAKKNYAEFLKEDVQIRTTIHAKYREAAISQIGIERQAKEISITLHTARPGIVIGRGGQRVDEMRLFLENFIGKRIRLNIMETRQPELDAYLVARSIAEQIEHRVAYRRAMKQSIFRTIQAGAKGIKVSCAGRLGNAEIARRQTMHQGQVPLHTLRADIDYGLAEAHTTMGLIGVKVWIYKGEILPEFKDTSAGVMPGGAATGTVAEPVPAMAGMEEAPATTVAEETAGVTPAVTEETPAKAEETVAVAVEAETPAEAAPAEAVAEKPEPKARKPKAKAEPTAETSAEAAPAEAVEEKPKTKARKPKAKAEPAAETSAEAAPALAEQPEPTEEEKDAAA